MKSKGSGKLAQRILSHLLDELTPKYPGVGIASEDFWFQKGDYVKATWDLARWGANFPHPELRGLSISVYSFCSMRECANGIELSQPRGSLAHEFEVYPKKA